MKDVGRKNVGAILTIMACSQVMQQNKNLETKLTSIFGIR